MAAAVPYIPHALAAVGVAGSLFGNENEGASPGGGQSTQGFAALPEPVKNAYLQQFLPGVLNQYNQKFQTTPLGQAPQGPFASQGLQELQDYSNQTGGIFGNGTGVNPLGTIEPFHEYQQQALQSFGGGIQGLGNELSQYMNPYQKFVQDEINRQYGEAGNQATSQFSQASGLGGLNSSAYGTLLSQLEKNRLNAQNNAQVQNYGQALGLRRQTLQDMLNAGGAIQQQGQAQLNALQPALQQTTPFARTGQLGQQLAMFPQSQMQSHVGATAGGPDFLAKLGTAANAGLNIYNKGGFGQNAGTGLSSQNAAASPHTNMMRWS